MACPSDQDWQRFVSGTMSVDDAHAAELHVPGCQPCTRTLVGALKSVWASGLASVGDTHVPAASGPVDLTLLPDAVGRYVPVLGDDGAPVELGRGGIGRVLLMTDGRLGRDVAVKVLLPDGSAGGDTRESASGAARFLREARVTGQLEHPAIVPVYELGQRPDGSLFYVMRQVRGRTLAQAIAAAPSLSARLALLPHLLAACQALAFAHSRRVVHRDLKPQNVMFDRYGETYVVDWGLARVLGQDEPPAARSGPSADGASPQVSVVRLAPDLTGAGQGLLGTPAYMAPEAWEGRLDAVDERSDVWGLGAILFEVLTATIPRKFSTTPEGRWQPGPVQDVLALEPTAPKELVAICTKALAEEPSHRYATAEQLAHDLDAWVHGREVQAYAYGPLELLLRFGRRYRAPLAVAAVALALSGSLAIRSWIRVRAERTDARRLADVMLVDVSRQLQPVPGSLPVLEAVTGRALEFYERVGREEGLSSAEREQLAMAICRLAQLNQKLGRFERGQRLAASGAAFVGTQEETGHEEPLAAAAVSCRVALGTAHFTQGQLEPARQAFLDAQVWVDRANPAFDSIAWLRAVSLLASSRFAVAYQDGDLQTAREFALQEVAADEKVRSRSGGDRVSTLALATSLMNAQLATLYAQGPAQAVEVGRKALTLLEGLPEQDTDAQLLERLSGARAQQNTVLRSAGQLDAAAVELEQARGVYERLLRLEPDHVAALGNYGSLLLRTGDVEKAYEVMKRADALGVRAEYEASFMESALLLGRLDEVLARREALESYGSHQGLWVLAVALALDGKPGEGAALARRAETQEFRTEWAAGALQRLARTRPGPIGEAVHRFAEEYEAAFSSAEGDEDAEGVLRRFADALDALASADGGAAH
ncbi:MAG: protein kinase [Archangium sp.]|nr:protein kinase [Archangium sp.]